MNYYYGFQNKLTMSLVEITRRICIPHEDLHSDINDCILERIKETTLNECTKEDGFILSIKNLVGDIQDNYISNANCENVFIVKFLAETLKPENGKQFTGIVCMIFSGGIFVNIKNKQKVLIPVSALNEYKFDQSTKSFKKNKDEIKEGDELDIIITGTKYSKQTFSCFGILV